MPQQDVDGVRLPTNTATTPDSDLSKGPGSASSVEERRRVAQGPHLHGSINPVRAVRCMCSSPFYYKAIPEKEFTLLVQRRKGEESRNASFELARKGRI